MLAAYNRMLSACHSLPSDLHRHDHLDGSQRGCGRPWPQQTCLSPPWLGYQEVHVAPLLSISQHGCACSNLSSTEAHHLLALLVIRCTLLRMREIGPAAPELPHQLAIGCNGIPAQAAAAYWVGVIALQEVRIVHC